MLPVKRGRGRPPKFSSAPNSPSPSSPVPNGYAENGKHKKFKYKRVISGDSPVDEVTNLCNADNLMDKINLNQWGALAPIRHTC